MKFCWHWRRVTTLLPGGRVRENCRACGCCLRIGSPRIPVG